MSPTLNQDSSFGDRQFMVITSEKQCRIVALPSQNCVYRLQITETDFVVRAEIVSMKGKILVIKGGGGCLRATSMEALQQTESQISITFGVTCGRLPSEKVLLLPFEENI
jgi:hypothetical protein